jgi:WD40 repeat protein
VWDLASGRAVATLEGHACGVTACAVTPDGRRVVSASEDKTLKVWNLESGRAVATLEGHAGSVWACAVAPDGRRVVSASEDRTLKVWDLETGACLLTHRASSAYHAVAATTTVIVAGDAAGSVWFLTGLPRAATRSRSVRVSNADPVRTTRPLGRGRRQSTPSCFWRPTRVTPVGSRSIKRRARSGTS